MVNKGCLIRIHFFTVPATLKLSEGGRGSTKAFPSTSYYGFFFLIPLNRLLYSVLPPSVANELRHKRPVPAKRYDNVTILFSGIVGFNAFCSKHASGEGAMKIVNLLNDLYTRFDTLTDSRKNPFVYKASSDLILTQFYSV